MSAGAVIAEGLTLIGYISQDALTELQDPDAPDNPLTIRHSKSIHRRAQVPVYLAAPARHIDTCAEMRALCSACGGTGDVTRLDGEYLGACDCDASAWCRAPIEAKP